MTELRELEAVFAERLIQADASLKKYASDMLKDSRYTLPPRAVVFPRSTEEVAFVMKWANRTGVPVTPRGAGSGLSGGAIASRNGVIISFEQMNRIIEVDHENMMVTLDPGVITSELDDILKPLGLFFAGYPMSEDICFIGGNVAENAGGGRAIKYGVTSQYVIGAEIVSPTGEIMKLGGKRLKDVAGYNLLQLLIGSEGTLGLFTQITLRLVPRPNARFAALFAFETSKAAAQAVSRVKTESFESPSSIEYIDGRTARQTIATIPSASSFPIPESCEAVLLVEFDGADPQEVIKNVEQAQRIVGDNQGQLIGSGTDNKSLEQCWQLRKAVPWWTKRTGGEFISIEDVVVPPASVPDLVLKSKELEEAYQVPIAVFGHAGDGNFHLTPMKPKDMTTEQWHRTEDALLSDLYNFITSLGGSISGEHGIGRKRVASYGAIADKTSLEVMKSIKRALDPNNVLNPGVVLSLE